jgi:hypothetical protein
VSREPLSPSYSLITIWFPDCAPNLSLITNDFVDIPLPNSKVEMPSRQHAIIEALPTA